MTEPNLDALAANINHEHAQAEAAIHSAFDHTRRAGELLLQAQDQCQREQQPWLAWLRANVRFSERTAQRYMRLARDFTSLQCDSASDLTPTAALKMLAAPAPAEAPPAVEPPRFDIFEETEEVYRWLCKRRDGWPDGLRHEFSRLVRSCADRMETDDAAERRLRDGSSGAGGHRLAPLLSSNSVEYYTPPDLLDAVLKVLGDIDLDPCSDSNDPPNVPALRHYTKQDDGLSRAWSGKTYLNPPYGRTIGKWIEKLVEEHSRGAVPEAIALVPSRTGARWFGLLAPFPCCFLRGRVQFIGATDPAPFDSGVFYLGPRVEAFLETFRPLGRIVTAAEPEAMAV
jgi:hypothetical protein